MIGIIGFNDLHLMPFTLKYTNILDELNISDYEVVFWNRTGIEYKKDFNGNAISYDRKVNTYLPFHKKILSFLGYAFFMRKVIKEKKYQKLIILTTPTAVPLYDILTRKYQGKYIYDYRDLTKETKSKFFKTIVRKLIRKSEFTMMSSFGFLKDLEVEKTDHIILSHNTRELCQNSGNHAKVNTELPIRIVFWGMVRQPYFNTSFCDVFGNDKRFTLTYHGEGFFEEIRQYCEKQGYQNIHFTGRYEISDISKFAEETDILHCVYEYDKDPKMRTALQVKMYDAIKYRIPLLLYSGSYVSEYVGNYALKFDVDMHSVQTLADDIYHWYRGIHKETLDKDFHELEKKVYTDDLQFKNALIQFVEA